MVKPGYEGLAISLVMATVVALVIVFLKLVLGI